MKVINPLKKSEYVVQKLRAIVVFKSIDEVKENLASFVQGVPSTIDQVGYIEPGHGVKGKQRWLSVSEDLEDMYTLHQQKHEILLWCYAIRPKQSTSNSKPSTSNSKPSTSKSSKRQHSPDQPSRKKTRYDNHTDKMMEVESIEDELLENHDGNYSREQIRAWAHLIQMGKHESYDCAPNKPFWKTPSGKKALPTTSPTSLAVSPGKKVQMQGQLVDQLLKWHDLLERGAIDQEQYNDMQTSIIEDVKKF